MTPEMKRVIERLNRLFDDYERMSVEEKRKFKAELAAIVSESKSKESEI